MGSLGEIRVLSSGSSGNCVLIYDSVGNYIMVDMGLAWDAIAKGVNYRLGECAGGLCSHQHGDHSRSLSKLIELGVPCYGNYDIVSRHKGCNLITAPTSIGGFNVDTFSVCHNVPNNGFVIDTLDGVRILYCTDASKAPDIVENVNYAIVEANWDAEIVFDNVLEGIEIRSQYGNHQSLDTCIEYLKSIKNDELQCVILWHLSNDNISAPKAIERVKRELGIDNVVVARPNLTIPIIKKNNV